MDTSIELLSSMSPKVTDHVKPSVRKPPSKLALKKNIRRSSLLPQNSSMKHDSIITVESTSTTPCSSSSKNFKSKDSPIVIPDSDASSTKSNGSLTNKNISKEIDDVYNTEPKNILTKERLNILQHCRSTNKNVGKEINDVYNTKPICMLNKEKFNKIQHWVNEVNSCRNDTSLFSNVSSVYGDTRSVKKSTKTNAAFNSTLMEPKSKKINELFKKDKCVKENSELTKKNASFNSTLSEPKLKKNDELYKKDKCVKVNSELTKRNVALLESESKRKLESEILDSLTLLQNMSSQLYVELKDALVALDKSFKPKSKIEDSLKNLSLDDSCNNALKHEKSEEKCDQSNSFQEQDDNTQYEELLDSIYGNSWRERKDDILPASEPRARKTEQKTQNHVSKTEKPKTKTIHKTGEYEFDSDNLLKSLQKARFRKALESPWMKTLENLCDPDSDPENETEQLKPVRLNFGDNEECDGEEKSEKETLPENTEKEKEEKKTKRKEPTTNEKITNKLVSNKNKSEGGCYSFLASLSAHVPMSKCDMSAWIYRNKFKEHRAQLATKLFMLYNEKIFESAIPSDTPLEWNDRMRGTAGYCYCKKIIRRTGAVERKVRIVLSSKVLDSADRLRDTLVHEMCHAVTWIVNQVADGHGPFWKSWADKAMKTFPELPPIKRCHQYVINTKYTYKCTDCGYSIGRHTKSLDIERKRCGYCYGKFEVFINKTKKNGETTSVPATPKKPLTGFARFVKENYATHKTPDLKHADVMKILGQKFSNLKCD